MKSFFHFTPSWLAPHPLRVLTLALALASAPVLAAETAAEADPAATAAAPATTSIQESDNERGFFTPVKKVFGSVTDLFSFGDDGEASSQEQAAADTAPAQPVPIDQPHVVGDLPYGDVLFEYYQQRYFAAITKILVAQQRGQFSRDSEHAQIVLGALYTSYGMLDKGEAIFRQLLASNATPAAADEAWYQLARIYYKSGDISRARDILTGSIVTPLEKRTTEHTLLLALCHIRLGETDQAKALLPYLKDDKTLSVFARFNLGSAFAQLGEMDQANLYFTEVAETKAKEESTRVLKDQATLALGVQYLKQEKWDDARAVLENIRLYGPVANRGLLALGWTWFNTSNQTEALTPWLELTERDLTDPAVQEALLNVPYVFEQQGALQEALDRYRNAHDVFRTQRDTLEQVKQNIMQPNWVEKISPVSLEDTRNVMGEIPPFKLSADDEASRYLYLYFASNEFQRIYRDYRELQRLYMVLVHWQRQLPSYNQMIATNVERLEKLGPKSEKAIQYSRKFHAYANVKLDEYSARLDQIIANDDLAGTATVPQLVQKERIQAAEATLKSLGEPELYEEEWSKLRMLKGLLMWDLNATATDRRWEMSKDRIAIENLLVELEQHIRAVEQARAARLDRFQGFEGRVAELDQRMTGLQSEIATALQHNRAYLQAVATGIVGQHQAQLDRMRAKALLSIARLQDRGYVQERERVNSRTLQPKPATTPAETPADAPAAVPTDRSGAASDTPVDQKPGAKSLTEAVRDILAE